MLALLLSAALLVVLSAIGIAIASLADRRISSRVALVSPSIGCGVLLALAFTLSRAGLPVLEFAAPLVGVLCIACGAIFALRRPQVPWDTLGAIAVPLAVGFLLAGLPMLLYGFSWAGNSNGDMTVYASSSADLMHHGFFDFARFDRLVSGIDNGQNMWFWEIMPPNRYGADMFLALVAAITGLLPYQIYMSCGVAAFGSLVLATTALVPENAGRSRAVLVSVLIAIGCPLMLYTVYQQILPQIVGQAALVAVVALIMTAPESRNASLQRAIALGGSATALLLVYPEISPLLALGAIFAAPIRLWHRRHDIAGYLRTAAVTCLIAGAVIIALFNVQLFTLAATFRVLFAVGSTVTGGGIGVINFYLVPSGLANMWGLMPFDVYLEPWLSIGIVTGAVLAAGVMLGAVKRLLRAGYGNAMLAGLLLFCVYLFWRRSSYGLFKIVFLVQPFAMVLFADWLECAARRVSGAHRLSLPAARVAFACCAVALTAYSTYIYLGSTSDLFVSSDAKYTEIHGASVNGLYGELTDAAHFGTAKMPFRTDALMPNLAILEGIAFRGHPLVYLTLDPFANMYGAALGFDLTPVIAGWPKGVRRAAFAVARQRFTRFENENLQLGVQRVNAWIAPSGRDGAFVETGPRLTVLNRDWSSSAYDVRAVPWRKVKPWLCLIDSSLGSPPLKRISSSLGPPEPDPFFRTRTMQTVGRSMLLEVLKGAPQIRLELDLTATYNPRPWTVIAPITVIGQNTVRLRSYAGSERVVTPPVRPFVVHGRRFIIIEFGGRLLQYRVQRGVLMSLFGQDVDLQPRQFTLHARDISVARPLQQVLPTGIGGFASALKNNNFTYAGAYEDGWLGADFVTRLKAPKGTRLLDIRVNVPPKAKPHDVFVSVDGKITRFHVVPSTYAEMLVGNVSAGVHEITLTSPMVGDVLEYDTRPAWGRLMSMTFAP